MSFTLPTASFSDAAVVGMQFEAVVATADATKNGKALLWGDLTGLATYLADAASTQAEVTAINAYTDGYAAGFTYTMDLDMTTAANAPSVDATLDTAQTQDYGVCFTGTETATDGTVTAGTSCAGMTLTYTTSSDAAAITVTKAMRYLYAPDQTTTVDTTATWAEVTENTTNAALSKSW